MARGGGVFGTAFPPWPDERAVPGVDVFFIMSGFIMGKIGSREPPKVFLRRRLVRIVPLYWLTTLAMCALSWLPGLMKRFTFTGPDLIKSLLFIPFTSSFGLVEPLLIPGWTLNYEMFFYLVFTICLLTTRPKFWALTLMLSLPAAGQIIVLSQWFDTTGPIFTTYTSPRLLEFAAGMALSITNPIKGARMGLLAILAGFAGITLRWLFGDLDVSSFFRLLLVGGPAALLVAGGLALDAAGRWPNFPVVMQFSTASYSLYLTHGFIVPLLARFDNVPILKITLGLALPTILAIITFRLFEKPVSRLLR
ncbi:MAG: acyltransferase [Novosphingobium sp.]